MKLVIATPLYPPEIGGPATYAKLLEDGLPGKGIEVELVKFSDVRHMPKLIRHYAYYRRVLRAARTADAVLALDPVSVGLPAMKAAKKAGKPFFLKIVGDYAWEQGQQRFGVTVSLDEFVKMRKVPFPVRVLQRVQTRVARSAARVIVPSEYLKSTVAAWGVPADKIAVIHNAVQLGAVGPVPEAIQGRMRPLLVTAGRLVPWKHIGGIIEAVELLHRQATSVSLAVIGDGPEREKLEDTARTLGNACVFTGRLSHTATLAGIKAADVFVLNSSYEGFSHLLVEALALGTPVIATDAGGNAEIVQDGKNGLLVPVGDVAALAKAMERLLLDVPLAQAVRAHTRDSVAAFSVDAMLSRTAELLQHSL